MTWNYRVVRFRDKTCRNGYFYQLCEVYYTADGKPRNYCEAKIGSETIKELYLDVLPMILSSTAKSFLKFPDDFREKELVRKEVREAAEGMAKLRKNKKPA